MSDTYQDQPAHFEDAWAFHVLVQRKRLHHMCFVCWPVFNHTNTNVPVCTRQPKENT